MRPRRLRGTNVCRPGAPSTMARKAIVEVPAQLSLFLVRNRLSSPSSPQLRKARMRIGDDLSRNHRSSHHLVFNLAVVRSMWRLEDGAPQPTPAQESKGHIALNTENMLGPNPEPEGAVLHTTHSRDGDCEPYVHLSVQSLHGWGGGGAFLTRTVSATTRNG